MSKPMSGTKLISGVVLAGMLAACGGVSERQTGTAASESVRTTTSPIQESPTASPTASTLTPTISSTPTNSATVTLNQLVHTSLLQRQDAGPGWQSDIGESPTKQPSANPTCERVARSMYEPADGAVFAKVGWYFAGGDQAESVTHVVRGYPTKVAATAYLTDLRTALKKCTTWKQGGLDGTGFTMTSRTLALAPTGDQQYAWVVTAEAMGVKAGSWSIATRSGFLISIVSFTPGTGTDGQRVASDMSRKALTHITNQSG